MDQIHRLTYVQESLVADQSAINVPSVVPLDGAVELGRVRQVLDTIVKRHGALRTVVERTVVDRHPDLAGAAGQLHQRIPAEGEIRLDRYWHEGSTADGLMAVLLAGSERPFVIENGRLARAELHIWSDGQHVLILWLHHVISDLVTSQVLGDEIARLWRGEELPGPSGQMSEFADYERGLAATKQQREFWSKTLAGVDDRLGIGYPDHGSPHLTLRPALPRLSAETVASLTRLASAGRTTLTAVLAAAVAAGHAEAAATDRVLFGLTISNRDHPQWRTVAGCLADQMPLVVDTGGRPTFRELLRRVRESLLDAYEHRLPLGVLLPLLPRPAAPAFAVNLNFLPPPARRSRQPEPPVTGLELPYGMTKSRSEPWWLGDAPLAYRPRINDGVLAGEIEGDGYLHDRATVMAYGERFCGILTAAAENPDRPLPALHTDTAPATDTKRGTDTLRGTDAAAVAR